MSPQDKFNYGSVIAGLVVLGIVFILAACGVFE